MSSNDHFKQTARQNKAAQAAMALISYAHNKTTEWDLDSCRALADGIDDGTNKHDGPAALLAAELAGTHPFSPETWALVAERVRFQIELAEQPITDPFEGLV